MRPSVTGGDGKGGAQFMKELSAVFVKFEKMLHVISKEPSVVNEYIAELRDADVQQDRARFRRNLERIGMAMGLMLSKELEFSDESIQTPLGVARMQRLTNQPVLATILRAGLPLHHGLASVFDRADQAFISACRKYREGDHESFYIGIDAVSSPRLDNRTLILDRPYAGDRCVVGACFGGAYRIARYATQHSCGRSNSERRGSGSCARSPCPIMPTFGIGDVDPELSSLGYIIPRSGRCRRSGIWIKSVNRGCHRWN